MVARADMESADTAAPIVATGEREAARQVIGVRRCGDDPVCHDGRSISMQGSGWERFLWKLRSGGDRERGALDLLVRSRCRPAVGPARRVAWHSRCARVCWRVHRSPCCDWSAAAARAPIGAARRPLGPRLDGLGGCLQHRACAVGEQHSQIAIPALGDSPEMRVPPEEYSLGVRPNQEAKWRASRKWPTVAAGGRHHRRRGEQPTPGIVSSVVQAGRLASEQRSTRVRAELMRASSSRISSTTASSSGG